MNISKTGSKRRGIVIFIAFAVIGIIGIFAAIYMFTSRQGKLQSRRIFWGELAFFLAESMVEETFAIMKHRSEDPRETTMGSVSWIEKTVAEIGSEAQTFDLPIREFSTMELLNSSFSSMGLQYSDIEVQVRTFVISSGEEEGTKFVSESEKIGTIEVVATVNLPVSSVSDAKVIRQAQGRRDFRFISVQGKNLFHDYALLIKKAPDAAESFGFAGNPALLVEAGDGFAPGSVSESDYKFGRVFLGASETESTRIIQAPSLTVTEQRYLQSSSDLGEFRQPNGPFENKITRYEPFSGSEPERAVFLLDSLLQDPNLLRVLEVQFPGFGAMLGPGGIDEFEYTALPENSKDILREAMRNFLRDYYQNNSSAEVLFSFYPAAFSYPSLNISIDGLQDYPVLVEGRTFRLFGFEGEVRYQGGFLGGGIEESRFPFYELRNAPAVYNHSPENSWYPAFYGQPGVTEANAEQKVREYLSYTHLNAFSYMFTNVDGKTGWEWFKTYSMSSDGTQDYINVDGIMVIVGDVHFERDTVFKGSGVLWITGRVQFDGGLYKSSPTNMLTIVSRASYQGTGSAVSINTAPEKEIQAHLQIHSIDFTRLGANLTASQPFRIYGGLTVDSLRLNSLPKGSKISYDAMLSRRIDIFSLSEQYNYYKIHNNQRVEVVD